MEFVLPALILVPLIGAIITLFMGGSRQKYACTVALVFTVATLLLSLILMITNVNDLSKFDVNYGWINAAGLKMSIILTVDGLSLLMVFLTAMLEVLVIAFSYKESDRPNYFYALLLAIEVGLMGVYLSADYFLFYIMWEVSLIPMYFLISWYGGPRRHYSAIKFFIYTHVASLVMLIGIFSMVFESAYLAGSGTIDFSFAFVKQWMPGADSVFQILVFAMLFFGFAVKMPAVPFHTWLPYGIIRVCIEALPGALGSWQYIVIAIGIISMIYGAYACIAQRDLKKMVAYSSISHMGLVMVAMGAAMGGVASGDANLVKMGIEFAIFQMFAHGLISGMLFLVCGTAGHNFGTREIPLMGGIASKVPVYAAFMMFCFMASLGLPGLIGFWGEFGIICAFYDWTLAKDMIYLLVFCLLSLLLTAGYYLWAMQRTLFGRITTKIDVAHMHDVDRVEAVVLGVLAFAIAIYGFWPDLAISYISGYAGGLI